MTYRIDNMPSQVSAALGLVLKYLLGESDLSQMLMDLTLDNEILEEQEEEEKDIAGTFLNAILNPLESTNRYLQYDFTRAKIGAGKGQQNNNIKVLNVSIDINDSEDGPLYCDKGWRKLNFLNGSQCWKHFDQREARAGAKQLCFEKNAELVKPATRADNLVLSGYVWDNEIDDCVWLGLNDLREEGVFKFDNSDVEVEYTQFSKHSRANTEHRNHVIFQPSANYSPKRERWFMANGEIKRCSVICVKVKFPSLLTFNLSAVVQDVGDRNRQAAAVINPLDKVNRFLSLGELDAYYEVVRKKVKNGEEVCDRGFEQVGNNCLMYRPQQWEKRTHKIECLKLGATLFAPMNEGEQEEMLGYLDEQSAEPNTRIWIGFNDGKVEGTYVLDNTKGAVLMPWENFRVEDNVNTEVTGSVVVDYQTGQWIRVDSYQNDTAVCSKPLLPK